MDPEQLEEIVARIREAFRQNDERALEQALDELEAAMESAT